MKKLKLNAESLRVLSVQPTATDQAARGAAQGFAPSFLERTCYCTDLTRW